MKTYLLVASVLVTVAVRGVAREYDWRQQDRILQEIEGQNWQLQNQSMQAEHSNQLLRENNQLQRYQAYMQEVAYHQQNHPDEPPPRPKLSPDPRDYPHNVFIMRQWANMTAEWEKKKNRRGAEAANAVRHLKWENLPAEYQQSWQNIPAESLDSSSPAPSDAELNAKFEQQIVESRAKRDRVYPEAAEPTHPIHEEAEKIWKTIEETEHELLNDPDAPFKVYEMAALRLGIKPTGQP